MLRVPVRKVSINAVQVRIASNVLTEVFFSCYIVFRQLKHEKDC